MNEQHWDETCETCRDGGHVVPPPHRMHVHTIVRTERVIGWLAGEPLVEESYDCPCGKDMTQEALGG